MDKYVKGLYASDASTAKQREFIVSRLAFHVDSFKEFLETNRDKVDAKGYFRLDLKRSMKDSSKIYGEINDFQPSNSKVTAKDHSPDRESSDLPF